MILRFYFILLHFTFYFTLLNNLSKLTSCFSNNSILRSSVFSSADLKPENAPAGGPDAGGPDCGRAQIQVENRMGKINRIVICIGIRKEMLPLQSLTANYIWLCHR